MEFLIMICLTSGLICILSICLFNIEYKHSKSGELITVAMGFVSGFILILFSAITFFNLGLNILQILLK